MKFPIIEFRTSNFFVLMDFEGNLNGDRVIRPHNRINNLTRYVVDSTGKVWTFRFEKHDCVNIKKLVSFFWNISNDYYVVETVEDKTVSWLKGLLTDYERNENPDIEDMANALLDSLGTLHDETKLSNAMEVLNL